MREHSASRDEVLGTWEVAHDEGRGMRSFKAWIDSADIAEQIRDYRTEAEYAAYDAAARESWQPMGECDRCKDPLARGTPAGTICRRCQEKAAQTRSRGILSP